MKKLFTVLAVSIFSLQLFAVDFAFRLMPEYLLPIDSVFNSTVAGKAAIDFAPFTNIRGRDSIFVGVNGGITPLAANGLENMFAYEASGSLGYTFRFTDRMNVTAEGYGGLWMVSTEKKSDSEDSDKQAVKEEDKSESG